MSRVAGTNPKTLPSVNHTVLKKSYELFLPDENMSIYLQKNLLIVTIAPTVLIKILKRLYKADYGHFWLQLQNGSFYII